MADSITAVVRDPETGEGMPGQTVKLRIGPTFSADLYTMVDITSKPGGYSYDGDYNTGKYKLWVNGSEDTSFGGANGKHIPNVDKLLGTGGGTMTGNIDMGSNLIRNLGDPLLGGDAFNFGYALQTFLSLMGDTMTGDINMDGNKVIGLPVPSDDSEAETRGHVADTYFPIEGGEMGGDIDMNNNYIDNLPAPADPKHPMRQTDGDETYISKLISAAAQQVWSQLIFRGATPYVLSDPWHAKHATNVLFVENYCRSIIAGQNPSAYQQSGNVIRVIPSGIAETNKVTLTLESGLENAAAFAASDRHMIVEIHGNSEGLAPLNYNLLPVGIAEEYVHILGKGEGIIVRVAEDTYEGTAGANIISNVIFDNEAEDASTFFENKIFYHCKFSNTFGSGNPFYDFVNCLFIGCTTTTGVTFDPDCKGNMYDLVNNRKILIGNLHMGSYDIADNNGDVRPRRLQGRKGSNVASGTNITLGNGNFFTITGTTSIESISATNWENGSRISLYFQSALLLLEPTLSGNILRSSGTGDYSVTAGELVELIADSTNWIILN